VDVGSAWDLVAVQAAGWAGIRCVARQASWTAVTYPPCGYWPHTCRA